MSVQAQSRDEVGRGSQHPMADTPGKPMDAVKYRQRLDSAESMSTSFAGRQG